MKELAHKIPGTINEILQANNEVINCYEQVKDTVGPHTRQIESIVRDLNHSLKGSTEILNGVSKQLKSLVNRCQVILDKKKFINDLKVGFTPTAGVNASKSGASDDAPTRGQRILQEGNQREYE